MKNTILLVAICLTLGFAVAWFAKPSAPEEANDPNPTRSTRKATPRSHSESNQTAEQRSRASKASVSSSVKIVSSEDELDEETKKQIEQAQSRQQKMMRNSLKKKFDMRIDAMVAELGLDANQEKALRDYFDKQLDILSSADPQTAMTDPEAMAKMAAAMRGDGLTEAMADHLSEDQQAGLEAMQARKKKNKIEGMAMKDLSKIQQNLDLTDDQRDEVYNILIEDAETKLENESDTNVVMNGMMKSMGIDMDLGDMDMGSMMQLDPAQNDGEVDPANAIAQIQEQRANNINAKVERMAPVLNETQLKQYRNHLESSGGMLNMMMQGMQTQGGGE